MIPKNISRLFKALHHFFTVDIWRLETHELSQFRAFLVRQSRIVLLIGKDVLGGSLHVRAATLTYRTLLSIIPFIALMFVLATHMGLPQTLITDLIPTVSDGQREILSGIMEYLGRTDIKAMGYVGVVFLLWVSLKLILEIEEAFNKIWGVKRRRNLLMRTGISLLLILVLPVVLLSATMLNAFIAAGAGAIPVVQGFTGVVSRLTQYLLVGLAFAGLYALAPNARVKAKPALLAGITAGLGWHLLQWAFIEFQVGVSRYNAIYGTFASMPLFLLWIYMSWFAVLAGCEYAFALQNERHYAEEKFAAGVSFRFIEHLGLGTYLLLFRLCENGCKPSTAEEVALYFGAPIRVVQDILYRLKVAGLLLEADRGVRETGYTTAEGAAGVRPLDVLDALKDFGSIMALEEEEGNAVMERIHGLEAEARTLLDGTGYAVPFSRLSGGNAS